MARPRKENADYFSHDCDMRSHRKIIALRGKYGLVGYAVYNMLLEHIAGCDYFIAKRNVLEKEILAGDFGVSVAEIDDIVSYCHRLDLVQIDGETLKCRSMIERLGELIEKRNRSRKGVSVAETHSNVPKTIVSVSEKPQSKVKETKVNKTITKNIISGSSDDIKNLFKQHYDLSYLEENKLKFYTLIELILLGWRVEASKLGIESKIKTLEDKCSVCGVVNSLGSVDWEKAYKAVINMRIRCEEKGVQTTNFMGRFGKFLSST